MVARKPLAAVWSTKGVQNNPQHIYSLMLKRRLAKLSRPVLSNQICNLFNLFQLHSPRKDTFRRVHTLLINIYTYTLSNQNSIWKSTHWTTKGGGFHDAPAGVFHEVRIFDSWMWFMDVCHKNLGTQKRITVRISILNSLVQERNSWGTINLGRTICNQYIVRLYKMNL